MDINQDAQVDTGQVRDVGSGGGGGGGLRGLPIPIGGGVGGLIVLVLLVVGGLVGGNSLFGGGGDTGEGTPVDCSTANPNRFDDVRCRNALYVNSIQNYWQSALPGYQEADTVFFQEVVGTGCGQADSGVGPFYCPQDDLVYIDLSFWNELASRFGADGEFAQAYVLAHEYGHHVQDLDGTEARVHRAMESNPNQKNPLSVELELQADCYAGVWTKHAAQTTDANGKKLFNSITDQDITDALEAASAVGDDAIQKKMGGSVDESQFTHGSSADRMKWYRTGYTSGDPKSCNTFA